MELRDYIRILRKSWLLTVVATPLVALLLRTDVAMTAAALASAPLLALIAAGQGILQGRGEFRALSWVLAVVGVARSMPIIGAFAAGAGPAGGLLAGMVGASRERVNKAIASFVRLGWIDQRERRYRILNRVELTRRAR